MLSRLILPLTLCTAGCVPWAMVQSPTYEAHGTWHGTVELVQVKTDAGIVQRAMLLHATDGPAARSDRAKDEMQTVGRAAWLVDRTRYPWPVDRVPSNAHITVTGRWIDGPATNRFGPDAEPDRKPVLKVEQLDLR